MVSKSLNFAAKQDLHVDVHKLRASQNKPKLDKLTGSEKNLLKKLKDQELEKYKTQCQEIFDHEKNWSVMISPDCNKMRN
jgi:hypothetical protein